MMKNCLAVTFTALILCAGAFAQTSTFTYQGRLTDTLVNASGPHDFVFRLYDSLAGPTQIGTDQVFNDLQVTNGIFTVDLDFGAAAFAASPRFLAILVRPGASTDPHTPLTPRQEVKSAPFAIKSSTASTANDSTNLNGQPASFYTDASNLTSGTIAVARLGNGAILNQATQQAGAVFNIDGDGTVGGTFSGKTVNATIQYNFGGSRILSAAGTNTLFAGIGAGAANTTGNANSFFGSSSGLLNTDGVENSFFGSQSGQNNSSGNGNSFFGFGAGSSNTTAGGNSFYGTESGSNSTGSSNSFFGALSGQANTTGNFNAFFGFRVGETNTTGVENAFFGAFAGGSSTGDRNAFFGTRAGRSTTGHSNAFFGTGAGLVNTTGFENAFFGAGSGDASTTGSSNTFIGRNAGILNTTGFNNAFVGRNTGQSNTTGSSNTAIGRSADVSSGALTFATAVGSFAVVAASNQVQLGRNGLDTVSIGLLAVAAATPVCINGTVLASCSSSLRYKENVRPFTGGLNVVRRLRPVTFDWKDREEADLGLIAEEVAEIEPLLTTHNQKGQIEGVKYDQIAVVLINAVKEQQQQIEAQQKLLADLQKINRKLRSQIDSLTKIICDSNARADICNQGK